jgi:hypothetical protein
MISKMKWSNYFKPTPKRFRVLGDSLAASSTFAASLSIAADQKWVGIAIIVCGWAGKMLTNFFAEENTTN